MFEELFARKILNVERALSFGFVKTENGYRYETDLFDGTFRLQVGLSAAGKVDTELIEKETGEAYVLYKTNSTGTFVGEVREGVGAVLAQVASQCYDAAVFQLPQTKAVIEYVRGRYGDELEFLWKKFPDNAVWRRKDTEKWYGAILTVSKRKLGLASDERTEILNLRAEPDIVKERLSKASYYPGWHMNKTNWYTVILDGSVETEELCKHLEESYRLAT